MKRLLLCLVLLVMFIPAACARPQAADPTRQPVAATHIPTRTLQPATPTPTPVVLPPDLAHHPLYWFAPLPPLPTGEGRPFLGSEDFMALFTADAPWQTAADHIQVFKLYGEWVANHPNDAELQQVVADLNRRGMAIAIETGPLDPEDCGYGVEGFATVESSLEMARSIKDTGGTLHLIALDEPYYYGHFYDGQNACHWPVEKIAAEVGEFIIAVREIFPDVIIGDTEPLTGAADAAAYQEWLDVFNQINGYPLAFLHLDVDWSRPNWTGETAQLKLYGDMIGVPIGMIYIGNGFDPDDEAWFQAAGERVKKLEITAGVQPDHILFQSWVDKPDHVLPESTPNTFTGFINQYFTDKTSLGYPREGAGANLALNATAAASQTLDESGPDQAVDGEYGTFWNSGGGAQQWIEIDLGKAQSIREIRLSISQFPEGATTHQVYVKSPGGDFVLVETFQGDTADGQVLSCKPEIPLQDIQWVRIVTLESPSWVAWREIEVIGAD